MTVPQNALDFGIVFVFFLETIGVGQRLFLSRQQWFDCGCGISFPNSDVGILTSCDDVACIHAVKNGIHLLHSLGMIDFPTATIIVREDSYCFVEGRCCKFLSGWGEVNIKNGLQMVFMDHLGLV